MNKILLIISIFSLSYAQNDSLVSSIRLGVKLSEITSNTFTINAFFNKDALFENLPSFSSELYFPLKKYKNTHLLIGGELYKKQVNQLA